jgi:hypothetical protein
MNQLILGDNLEIMRNIAVKAVDNEGLEAIEIVKVKVNGEIVVE